MSQTRRRAREAHANQDEPAALFVCAAYDWQSQPYDWAPPASEEVTGDPGMARVQPDTATIAVVY
jgi:hypothetical protein